MAFVALFPLAFGRECRLEIQGNFGITAIGLDTLSSKLRTHDIDASLTIEL